RTTPIATISHVSNGVLSNLVEDCLNRGIFVIKDIQTASRFFHDVPVDVYFLISANEIMISKVSWSRQ
ncbi:hypothetical protein AB1N83_010739, partial [Pleurotus pulmonarius]